MKGQVTVWIILALILIAAILIFMLSLNEEGVNFLPRGASEFSVESYLSNCIQLEVEKATSIMLPQGGFVSPTNYRIYNKTSVAYICETKSYFEPCINQHPVLIENMEQEILQFISPGVGVCLDELEYEIESRGGQILFDSGTFEMDVELEFDEIVIKLNRPIEIIEKESQRSFNEFVFYYDSSAYNLAIIAQEIANQEASFCYFETTGYGLAYPRYSVTRKTLSDQSKIYIMADKVRDETMMVAVRSCALPEGMPG